MTPTRRTLTVAPARRRGGPASVAAASACVLILGLLSPPLAAAAPGAAPVVAPPNSTTTGFVPPTLVVPRGGSIDVVGADTTAHNLACAKKTKRRPGRPRRPLCMSGFVAAGQTAPVKGVAKLKPGTYGLRCQLHPKMTVELTVLDTPPVAAP